MLHLVGCVRCCGCSGVFWVVDVTERGTRKPANASRVWVKLRKFERCVAWGSVGRKEGWVREGTRLALCYRRCHGLVAGTNAYPTLDLLVSECLSEHLGVQM